MILSVCAGMPSEIADIISKVINIIKIVVPVGLVIFGMLDFAKATMAQKDDEIAKGKNTFFKRLISGALVFFVIAIVQLLFNLLDTNGSNEAISCLNAILNGSGGTSYGGSVGTQSCGNYGPSNCKENPNCAWYGPETGEGYCAEKGGKYTTKEIKYEYETACKFAEKLDGNKYEQCKNCYNKGHFRDGSLKDCVNASSYDAYKEQQESNNDCSKTKNQKIETAMNKCKEAVDWNSIIYSGGYEEHYSKFNGEINFDLTMESVCDAVLKGELTEGINATWKEARQDYLNAVEQYNKCLK